MMSAYGIYIRERTRDPAEMAIYADMATPLLSLVKATILAAYGVQDVLEGPSPEGVVIVRYASIEAARAFYDSPEYRAAIRHRFLGADYRSILVQGVDN